MPIKTEKAIQASIIKHLKKHYKAYIVNGIFTERGIPDLICNIKGRFVAIEVKKPDTVDKTTPLQKANISIINSMGGVAFIATSIEDVDNNLNGYGFERVTNG